MMMFLSKFLDACSFRLKSEPLKISYKHLQNGIQNKLLLLLRLLLSGLLVLLGIYSRVNCPSLYNILAQNLHFIVALATLSVPTPWPTIQNYIFLFLLWLFQLNVLSDFPLAFSQQDKTLIFITGFSLGMIEVLLTFALKKLSSRLLVLALLTITKIISFSQQMQKTEDIWMILGGMSMISIIFFTYHNLLDQENYKIMSDSHDKLIKFQTLLADDFPISVIIISSNLKHVFYSNQYFAQNFCQRSQLLGGNEPIETLFQKITLEFDDINQQIDFDLGRISLYTFITDTANIHPRFNNRDVFNLYSLYQDEGAAQRHYEIKIRKVLWEETQAYTIIFNDVSDKQKASVLQESDEQRDRVLATITHELKTPINGILGLLEIICFRTKDSVSKAYLEHCKNCSKLLLYLVNSILDLSELRKKNLKIEKTRFSLDELLKEIQSLYTFVSEHRGIQFKVSKSHGVPDYIYTDKYRLISILVQLLGNAMKFTFKGFVKLKVELSRANPQKLNFIVEDSGVGIQEEDKIKLFNMFGQITSKKKNLNHHGAGLGITIANELVLILNGPSQIEQIECESEFGVGTVFKFRIEFTLDDATKSRYLTEADSFAENTCSERELGAGSLQKSIKAVERTVLGNRRGLNVTSKGSLDDTDHSVAEINKKKALIVDDNPFNLVAASFIVSKLDFQPLTAANGEDAIHMLQESMRSGQHYSFILMDIQMPIMDGIQATKAINQMVQREELYNIPIIALTAKRIDNEEERVYKDCGMFGALGKPLAEQELRNILKKCPKLR